MSETKTDYTPIHQWTHDGDKVLLVKCVERGGKSHGGFQWPKSGTVTTQNWSKEANCDSGGLFGWAWGLNLGGGKAPDYRGDWIVFAADPKDVVDLSGKQKAGPTCEVVYYGEWLGALLYTAAGREAWIQHRAASSSTGYRAASSSTGYRAASSSTGDYAASSSTGDYAASSSTGDYAIAAITGLYGTLEVGAKAAGVCTADEFTWIVHLGAVVLHRWSDGHATLTTEGLAEGDKVRVVKGVIQK